MNTETPAASKTNAPRAKLRLGDLLVQNKLIDDGQLQEALQEQRKTGRKLGATLIAMKLVTEMQLLQLLSEHLKVVLIDLSDYRVNQNAVRLLPEIQARRYRALVIDDKGDTLLVAMTDPADLNAVDELSAKLPKPIEVGVVSESQLFAAYENFYRKTEEIASFATELADEYDDEVEFNLGGTMDDEQDNLVAKLLQSIFEDAVMAKASDIHIEPGENQLRIRQRVDGVLQENIIPQSNIAAALILRLKLMSGLDISEKRLPQDGRTQFKVKNREIDVRVSTMPIQYGESVVMRLLDQSEGVLSLEQTGMPAGMITRFRRLLSRPHGMILVTGPTGSGKTTTLYGSLNELNQPESKIITVEDPVEYRLPRINQVQVNPKIDLTFANVLRTTLRQDPDILMVGEMRDQETVEIGLRGALTGHLVLSTLHTNDAISSAIRLIDMGAPGYLVASSLKGIVAQRLVRKLCERCAVDAQPDDEAKVWLSQIDEALTTHTFKHAGGCQSCNYVGYKGRVGVFELLEMNEPMMKALKNADTAEFSYQANLSEGYRALALAALDYAKQGITSLDEVMKLVEIVNNDGSGGNEQPLEQIDIAKAQAKQGPKTDGFSLEDVD
ncbi:Flp pilus assembly complex ATPase component TadA [Glaciecola sp. XM2]|uniref:GspE/PulE family protein n=1 Tax=Glaciecola sp. XM2 TaxID=1914931 RepID=UPI001BDEE1CF|nr:GspE/PulE family protein [Glaciecola sp. XM2]MBT1451690.1 Flp pilus assembly complex ATPase component TadA [Glaciecola sp. XM2]